MRAEAAPQPPPQGRLAQWPLTWGQQHLLTRSPGRGNKHLTAHILLLALLKHSAHGNQTDGHSKRTTAGCRQADDGRGAAHRTE